MASSKDNSFNAEYAKAVAAEVRKQAYEKAGLTPELAANFLEYQENCVVSSKEFKNGNVFQSSDGTHFIFHQDTQNAVLPGDINIYLAPTADNILAKRLVVNRGMSNAVQVYKMSLKRFIDAIASSYISIAIEQEFAHCQNEKCHALTHIESAGEAGLCRSCGAKLEVYDDSDEDEEDTEEQFSSVETDPKADTANLGFVDAGIGSKQPNTGD